MAYHLQIGIFKIEAYFADISQIYLIVTQNPQSENKFI